MKTLLMLAVLALAIGGDEISGQATTKAEILAACKAHLSDTSTPQDIVRQIESKLGANVPKSEHIRLVVVDSRVINAFTVNVSSDHAVICLPQGMIDLMADAESELAFMISHEVGHTLDKVCKTEEGRYALTHSRNNELQQRACETRADEIGFTLLRRSGYPAVAAAGAFGRTEMVYGSTRTGFLARFMAGDHPITPDRIENLRRLLINDASTQSLNP